MVKCYLDCGHLIGNGLHQDTTRNEKRNEEEEIAAATATNNSSHNREDNKSEPISGK